MRRMLIGLVVWLIALGAAGVRPAGAAERYLGQSGWGLAAVGANLFYVPGKLAYATTGALTGCVAYLLTVGNADTAQAVWSPSLGGTYVLSAEMLRGDQPILFSGESYEPTP